MLIAIDGPAASGKGTIAEGLARHFALKHLDTGLLYRAVGLKMIDRLEARDFSVMAIKEAQNVDPQNLNPLELDAGDVALAAAKVARVAGVRKALFQVQRDFATQKGGAVLDGRDIGSRICPEADVKMFITASPEVRAARRTAQLGSRGIKVNFDETLKQIIERDESDRTNPAGAFYPGEGAHLLDTSNLDIESSLRAAIAIVDGAVTGKPD
ncbi:Cytidylate kinase [hydrothermal vent metagenome]|uniref:(d)CMP kinase n=1 Tax=hydrothermal vent metagenome TaxID=652676 RepID=A0A3B0TRF4_9ZZZZ